MALLRDTDFDVSSPVPQSLISSIHSDDFSFSLQDDAGPSRKRPLPSMSTSFMISPLRRAMKMSGILETPPTDVPCSFNPRPYSVLDFTRQEVHPVVSSPKQASGLTQLLRSPAAPITNPFSHLCPQSKSKSAGKEPQSRITITVYFPHASAPSGDGLVLDLPEEARVEELIGLALWTYWEKGWLPQLSVNHTEDREACKLIATSWHVYPVNDGFVDYEYGAHDPSDKVRLLNGVVEFALLKNNKGSATSFKDFLMANEQSNKMITEGLSKDTENTTHFRQTR
ncbi:Component of a membrane-bound complex containing the Tor2p kinase [Marasmius sp. AFHP31]|nr:Component of a membrane-bound complex containing the Tor2p kinase [Marasmius sp. AFHP31]